MASNPIHEMATSLSGANIVDAKNTSDAVMIAAGKVITRGYSVPENYIKQRSNERHRRWDTYSLYVPTKTAASVRAARFDSWNKNATKYDKTNFSFQQRYGIDLRSMSSSVNETDLESKLSGLKFDNGQNFSSLVPNGSLTDTDINNLIENGTITRKVVVAGKPQTISLDLSGSTTGHLGYATNINDIRQSALNTKSERANNRRLVSRVNEDKEAVVNSYRPDVIRYIQTHHKGLASFDGTKDSCEKLINSGSLSSDEQDILKGFIDDFGYEKEDNDNFTSSSHFRGREAVSNKITGNDAGIKFQRNQARAIKGLVRSSTSAAFALGKASTSTIETLANKRAITSGANSNSAKIAANMKNLNSSITDYEKEVKDRNNIMDYGSFADKMQLKLTMYDKKLEKKGERRVRNGNARAQKYDKKINKATSMGDTKKVNKLRNKARRRKEKDIKRADKSSRIRTALQRTNKRIVDVNALYHNTLNKFFNTKFGKFVSSPIRFRNLVANVKQQIRQFIRDILKKAAKSILKVVMGAVSGLLGATGLSMIGAIMLFLPVILLVVLLALYGSAIVENFKEGLVESAYVLDNLNYVQLVINDASETLEKNYFEIAQNDAYLHYNHTDSAVPSHGISWTKAPNEAEIGKITNQNGVELAHFSNLPAVIGMTKYRMPDFWDYSHYYTVEAYAYWLWVCSHHTGGAPGTGIPDYSYKPIDECSLIELDNCDNVYFHGYDSSKSLEVNAKRNKRLQTLAALGFRDQDSADVAISYGRRQKDIVYVELIKDDKVKAEHLKDCWKLNPDGTSVCQRNGDSLHTHVYVCDNAIASATDMLKYDFNLSHPVDEHLLTDCPGYEHGELNVSTGELEHLDSCYVYYYDPSCSHIHDPNTCDHDVRVTYSCGHTITYDEDEDYDECAYCGNSNIRYTAYDYSDCDHDCGTPGPNNDCFTERRELVCDLELHSHIPWSESNIEGTCFVTKYTCQGHCGGHISPVINIWVERDYEGLIAYDNAMISRNPDSVTGDMWLCAEDLNVDFSVNHKSTLKDWNDAWDEKMAGWFKWYKNPVKRVSERFQRNSKLLKKNMEKSAAELLTGVTSNISEEDEYGFEGWFNDDGTIKESELLYLKEIYGSEEDDFEEAKATWEEFDVVFPVCGKALTNAQITAILEHFNVQDPQRAELLTQAMKYCGQFSYSITHPQNKTAESGPIDCSGFVESVLYHSIGWNEDRNWTALGFAKAGNRIVDYNNLVPGDILAINNCASFSGGSWHCNGSCGISGHKANGNHVIIYLGTDHLMSETTKLKTGLDNSNGPIFIIDCTSDTGCSSVRSVSSSNIRQYKYLYNPYADSSRTNK